MKASDAVAITLGMLLARVADAWDWLHSKFKRTPPAPVCTYCGGEPIYCEHTRWICRDCWQAGTR